MSSPRSIRSRAIRALLLLALVASSPHVIDAQYPQPAIYVCQTATFWCTFQYAAGAPNGSPCYCRTLYGAVGGYSIDPNSVPNAPRLPAPQPQPRPGTSDPTTTTPGSATPGADDCYKGLGNCAGSFVKRRTDSSSTTGLSRSPFGASLQKIIDALTNDVSSLKGRAHRGTSRSDTFDVTVVPPGLENCTLFIPRDSKLPWVNCDASEGYTFSRLVGMVADALGARGEAEGDDQTWTTGGVEVRVNRRPVEVEISRVGG